MIRPRSARCALLLATALACPAARAETQEAAVVRIGWIFSQNRYDEVVAQANAVIARWPSPDLGLFYLRGYARLRQIRPVEARADLSRIGDYRPPFPGSWPAASELGAQAARMEAAFPPIAKEVRQGGEVAFHAYVDVDDAWTRAILALLPDARRIGGALLGSARVEVPVFVFSSRERLDALMSAGGLPRRSDGWAWSWATGSMLVFCRANVRGQAPDADAALFRSAVAHEYAHLLVNGAIGSLPLPTWLNEGVAMLAGGRASPEMVVRNDQAVSRLRATGTLLRLEELGDDRFYASYEASSATPDRGPDAYEQTYGMVRYLVGRVGDEGLRRIFAAFVRGGDLGAAFRSVYGADVARFYDDWRRSQSGVPTSP